MNLGHFPTRSSVLVLLPNRMCLISMVSFVVVRDLRSEITHSAYLEIESSNKTAGRIGGREKE